MEKNENEVMKENNTNSKTMIIILGIALVLACGILLFVILNKENKENNNTNTPKEEETPKDKTKYTNWLDYLESHQIIKAEATRIRNIEWGNSENIEKTVQLTSEQLKNIFNILKARSVVKSWTQGIGNSGPTDNLKIIYEANGKQYSIELINFQIFDLESADDELKRIIDEISIDVPDDKDLEDAFSYYSIDEYLPDEVIDELFK